VKDSNFETVNSRDRDHSAAFNNSILAVDFDRPPSLRIPLSMHYAIPRSEDGVSGEALAHSGSSEFSRRETDVEACVPLSQETGRRIHVGVRVVHFVLCGRFALDR
jgi:hypothetical protein